MKTKGGVILTPGELEWLKSLNSRKKFHSESRRQYRRNIRNGFKHLPERIDLFLEEINTLFSASEDPKLNIDSKDREIALDRIRKNVLVFLGSLEPPEIPIILENAKKEFNRVESLFDLSLANDMAKLLSKRLKKINIHPGLNFGEKYKILDELKFQSKLKVKRDGSYEILKPTPIDKLRKLSDKKLQSAMDKVKSEYDYWVSKKEYFDKKFLLNRRKRALNIVKRIEKSDIWANEFNKKGNMKLIKKMYKRGLINSGLSKKDMIRLYKKNALKSAKKCRFNKIGFKGNFCKCIDVDVFKEVPNLSDTNLCLTEYSRELLSKLKN